MPDRYSGFGTRHKGPFTRRATEGLRALTVMSRQSKRRARAAKKRSGKAGLPPGTLVHIGERKTEQVRITVVEYDDANFRTRQTGSVEECSLYKDKPGTTWINVNGIHQVKTIEEIGNCFDLHPLLLEDVLDTGQRPKMEDYGEYAFIVLKMLHYNETDKELGSDQVSLILGRNYVISFQEGEGDAFNGIRERVEAAKGRIRKMGADYLVYSLVDSVVDNYFFILEKLGEEIESLEDELLVHPRTTVLQAIQHLKREMVVLRRAVWPLREVLNVMQRGDSALVTSSTRIYLRDVYDHTVQVIETAETYRDIIAGMLDIYMSSVSNRLNEVMKFLTIISTIFIPLTFLAGVYGMNFKYMPELEWPWGYPAVVLLMLACSLTMLLYFKKKGWL